MLAGYFAEHGAHVHTFTWLARVPSISNIVDLPSKNDISAKSFQPVAIVCLEAVHILNELITRLADDGETGCGTNHSAKKTEATLTLDA